VAKSLVGPLFNEWLTLMEKAYDTLNYHEFRELENKIKNEISFHRRRKNIVRIKRIKAVGTI